MSIQSHDAYTNANANDTKNLQTSSNSGTITETGNNATKPPGPSPSPPSESKRNYKGFVAGIFSGIAKLSGTYHIFIFGLLGIFLTNCTLYS